MAADRGHELQIALTARLLADADVAALVGARIYDRVPQEVTFPYIQITQDIGEPWDGVGLDGWEQVMRFDIWSRDAGHSREAVLIARTIYQSLHGQDVTISAGEFINGRMLPSGQTVIREDDGRTVHVVNRYRFVTQG